MVKTRDGIEASQLTRATEIDFSRPVLCLRDGDEPVRNATPAEVVRAGLSELRGDDGVIVEGGEWCVVI